MDSVATFAIPRYSIRTKQWGSEAMKTKSAVLHETDQPHEIMELDPRRPGAAGRLVRHGDET